MREAVARDSRTVSRGPWPTDVGNRSWSAVHGPRSTTCSLLASNQMRRGFSIFLILFFGLGPLSVFIDSEDANLPACCRRHGAHHCAMAAVMGDAVSGKTPIASTPLTCPEYPGLGALFTAPAPALTVTAAGRPAVRERARVALADCAAPEATPTRIHAGRGPPRANPS